MVRNRKTFAEQLDEQREVIWAEAGERRGSISFVVAIVGSLLVLYLFTAEKTIEVPSKFIEGIVIDSEERVTDKGVISHLKVKLPDESIVGVKLPKFVFPIIGARMKLYIDRASADESGVPTYRYVDYLD